MYKYNIAEEFNTDSETIFKIVSDYLSYPDFLDHVKDVKVIKREGNVVFIECLLNLVKKFKYTIRIEEDLNKNISWKLIDSDLLCCNEGQWTFKQISKTVTLVEYDLTISAKKYAPKSLVNKIASGSLPILMKSCRDRLEIVR